MSSDPPSSSHQRRRRYAGKNPRRFEDKYKELQPEMYPETVAQVLAAGKTPAGMHVPIMVSEVLSVLALHPGDTVIDCTLGFGGHAEKILGQILPGGRLIGLDVDPVELPRTEARLRALGFGPDALRIHRTNFAGLPRMMADERMVGADAILADLGTSSMQLDTPSRGFSLKSAGPLDMRMNPQKGQPASALLTKLTPADLAAILRDHSDEPRADLLAARLAGRKLTVTSDLTQAVHAALPKLPESERDKCVRRVFQALRIAVNDEFTTLDTLLRHLPACLNPGGRVAVLTFHSGEDRRVKKAFAACLRGGCFSRIAEGVIRPGPEECRANPRASSAKLRWAEKR